MQRPDRAWTRGRPSGLSVPIPARKADATVWLPQAIPIGCLRRVDGGPQRVAPDACEFSSDDDHYGISASIFEKVSEGGLGPRSWWYITETVIYHQPKLTRPRPCRAGISRQGGGGSASWLRSPIP